MSDKCGTTKNYHAKLNRVSLRRCMRDTEQKKGGGSDEKNNTMPSMSRQTFDYNHEDKMMNSMKKKQNT